MGSTREVWQKMAALGKGDYLAIPQDGGRVRVIATPYDEEIIIIQRKLNVTIIPYGSTVRQSAVKEKAKMYEAAPAPAAADMSSYVNKSKSGGAAVTGDGDLVQDLKEGKITAGAVPQGSLPPEMQKMSPAEQADYIKEKTAEREKLSKELAGLVQKRDAYVREEEKKAPKEKGDSFDSGVKKTLEKQMK